MPVVFDEWVFQHLHWVGDLGKITHALAKIDHNGRVIFTIHIVMFAKGDGFVLEFELSLCIMLIWR